MIKSIPSLSQGAYVSDIKLKADLAMTNFFTSEASQSNTFVRNITSITDINQRLGHDIDRLISVTRDVLSGYLGRLFDYVVVDVYKYDEAAALIGPKVDIVVRAMVGDDNVTYSMQRLLEETNGSFKVVNELNSFGTLPDNYVS